MKKLIIILTLLGFVLNTHFTAQAEAIICPPGYFCTPISIASTTNKFERIFYMSNGFLTDGIQSFQKNASSIDIVAPQMYTLDYDLKATGSIPDQIKTIAKTNNVKIMPLITNQNFSQVLMHNFLSSATAESNVISYLVTEAKKENYNGWQFDFEHMMSSDSDSYSNFVEKAASVLHQNNLILSVATVMRIDDDPTTFNYKNWSGVYNYTRLAQFADFLSIMTYDDPNSVGPVASIPYDKSVLDYLVVKVPPNKISLGIPLYYYGWDETNPPGKIIRHSGTDARLQYVKSNYSSQEYFSTNLGVPYLTYKLNGHAYIIWYEDSRSIQEKINLAKKYNLRGYSAWVMGLENPDVWNAFNKSI